MKTTAETTTETTITTHPFYDITTNRIATKRELLVAAATRYSVAAQYSEVTLSRFPNVTAEALATIKDRDGITPLHGTKDLRQIPGASAEFLATLKDNHGRTPLHFATELHLITGASAPFLATVKDNHGGTPLHSGNGSLHLIDGATAPFLATLKDNNGWTPLHCTKDLHLIYGATAEFLATIKSNSGRTPLHIAVSDNRLHLITGITVELLQTLGLLDVALRPENIVCLTEDLRTTSAHYNKPGKVRTALLKAARSLNDFNDTITASIRHALSAALEGGFQLPVKSLARLM